MLEESRDFLISSLRENHISETHFTLMGGCVPVDPGRSGVNLSGSSGAVSSRSSYTNKETSHSGPVVSDLERFVGMFDKKVGNRFENRILPVSANKMMPCSGPASPTRRVSLTGISPTASRISLNRPWLSRARKMALPHRSKTNSLLTAYQMLNSRCTRTSGTSVNWRNRSTLTLT